MSETQIITKELADYTEEQRKLITDVLCKGASKEEISFFMQVANRCHLDPFKRQIHAVKRWDSKLNRETLTFQVSIEGLRAIAARSGEYAGNDEPQFTEDSNGFPIKASVTVWRLVKGNRAGFTATAYYEECFQTKKGGEPNTFWASKPRTMLGKCAEAAALRKGFPEESGGLYTEEEINDDTPTFRPSAVREVIAPVTVLPPQREDFSLDEAVHWSELLPNNYKMVEVPWENCTVGDLVNDAAKRTELITRNPRDGSALCHAIDCILFKMMERIFPALKATEDQVSTELNQRGLITGSILEQSGESLMEVYESVLNLKQERWKA